MLSSELGCTPEREQKRKSKDCGQAGSFVFAVYTSFPRRYWSLFDLGIKISKCSFFSVIALALNSSNSLTLNESVKPKENMNVVLSPFNVYEGPAKRLQTLILIAIEIFAFS